MITPSESRSLNLVLRWLFLFYQADLQARALSDSSLPPCLGLEQTRGKEQDFRGW